MPNPSVPSSLHPHPSRLTEWVHQVLAYPGSQVRCRVRGNTLHLLYEGEPCPEQQQIIKRVLKVFQAPATAQMLHLGESGSASIYQVWLYGRSPYQIQPIWTFRINLDQLDHYFHQFQIQPRHETPHSIASSNAESHPKSRPEARTRGLGTATPQPHSHADPHDGHSRAAHDSAPELAAIARQLGEVLSRFGVTVKVRVKALPYPASTSSKSASFTSSAPSIPLHPIAFPETPESPRRLGVACRASYSPSPSLIADPIARQLRSLHLNGFRDAIVSVQVIGEDKPDWTLRIDLTPEDTLLRAWARWGDVAALSRLMETHLAPLGATVTTATLKDTTLHVVCQLTQAETEFFDAQTITTPLQELLNAIAPQGVQSAVLYGQSGERPDPIWVECLTLPASEDAERSVPTLTLAQNGHWEAIAFLLSRLLNPDLETQMATGGIRIQLLPKDDLLHVMCDAPVCPAQDEVTAPIVGLLQQLNLSHITGVRIYGRRSGLRTPLWSYGTDFVARQRFVPEPEPEFAATAAYINDLVNPSEESPLRPDLTAAELWQRWAAFRTQAVQTVRRSLLKTQLVSLTSDAPLLALPGTVQSNSLKTAIVWAAVGVLSVVQVDWLLGYMAQSMNTEGPRSEALEQPPPAFVPSVETADSQPETGAIASEGMDADVGAAWTDPASEAPASPGFTQSPEAQSELAADPSIISVSQPAASETFSDAHAAILEDSPYPPFNSQQLDLKLALYHQRLAEVGPPEVVVVGSSRAMRGIDPVVLEESLAELGYPDVDVFNFGVNGATAQVVELILQRILVPDQLPKLVIWADGARAFNSGREDVTYNGIATSEGYEVLAAGDLSIATPTAPSDDFFRDTASTWRERLGTSLSERYQTLDEWLSDRLAQVSVAHDERDRLKSTLQDSLTAWIPTSSSLSLDPTAPGTMAGDATFDSERILGQIDLDGFLPLDVRFDPVTYYETYARVPGNYDKDYGNFQLSGSQADALQTLIRLGETHNIPVVFINLPLTEEYLDPYRMGYEQEFRQYMLSQAIASEKFIFRDLGELWLTETNQDYYGYFSDPSHLNRYGAFEVSKRLAQDPMIPWSAAQR